MDPFTAFVVTVAGQVLAGVLTDSLTGQRRVRTTQLKAQAASMAVKHSSNLSQDDLDYVVARVLSEVRYLANQHPDIELTRSGITVVPDVPQSVTDHAGLAREDVRVRLERLGRIVAIRRNELEIATAPHKSESPTDPSDIPVKRVAAVRDSEYWRQRLDDLEASVRARHEGSNEG